MRTITNTKAILVALAVLALGGAAAPGAGAANASGLVVSQVYGGGATADAVYAGDYVELHNTRTTAVPLSGWSVQYAPSTSDHWRLTTLAGSIPAGGYYLVGEATGSTGADLPRPDATGTIPMSATAGKVALVHSATALTCDPCDGTSGIADFVGYGTAADDFEGSGPAPSPSSTKADARLGEGQTDTDDNAHDFAAKAPHPRNSTSTAVDVTPPTVTVLPHPLFIVNTQLRPTSAPIRIRWGATDAGSGVCGYSLDESVDGGAYTPVTLPTPTATDVRRYLAPGTTAYRFRVVATDCAGNHSAPVQGRSFTLTALDETSSRIAYAGAWARQALTGAYGGFVRYSTTAGSTATVTLRAHGIAWVSPRDASRGRAHVALDAATVSTVDLGTETAQIRRVVWLRGLNPSSSHTIVITNAATSGRPRIDVDAILVLS